MSHRRRRAHSLNIAWLVTLGVRPFREGRPREAVLSELEQLDQIMNIIRDRQTSTEALQSILLMAKAGLNKSVSAIALIERIGVDCWTFDAWLECLSISAGEISASERTVHKSQWDGLSPMGQMEMRMVTLNTLNESRTVFADICGKAEGELARRHQERSAGKVQDGGTSGVSGRRAGWAWRRRRSR